MPRRKQAALRRAARAAPSPTAILRAARRTSVLADAPVLHVLQHGAVSVQDCLGARRVAAESALEGARAVVLGVREVGAVTPGRCPCSAQ